MNNNNKSIVIRKIMSGRSWYKKEKIVEKILSKIGPKSEPWGTQDVIVSKSLSLLFI